MAKLFVDAEMLISEIERRPCLWDIRTPEYSHKAKKQRAWCEVSNALATNYDRATFQERREIEQELIRKWKGIRSSFSRELQKRKTMPAGSPAAAQRKAYVYFDQLQFLLPIATNKRSATLPETEGDFCSVELEEMTTMEELRRGDPSKKRMKKEEGPFIESVTSMSSMDKGHEKEDEDRYFFLSLIPEVKKVDADRRMDCKLEIMSVIRRYQTTSQMQQGFYQSPSQATSQNFNSFHTPISSPPEYKAHLANLPTMDPNYPAAAMPSESPNSESSSNPSFAEG